MKMYFQNLGVTMRAYFQNYDAGKRFCDGAAAMGYKCWLVALPNGWGALCWEPPPPKPLRWYERHPILAGIIVGFLHLHESRQ